MEMRRIHVAELLNFSLADRNPRCRIWRVHVLPVHERAGRVVELAEVVHVQPVGHPGHERHVQHQCGSAHHGQQNGGAHARCPVDRHGNEAPTETVQ